MEINNNERKENENLTIEEIEKKFKAYVGQALIDFLANFSIGSDYNVDKLITDFFADEKISATEELRDYLHDYYREIRQIIEYDCEEWLFED